MTGTRRHVLGLGGSLVALALVRPAHATPAEMAEAVRGFAGEAPIQQGRVVIDIPPLVENGNAVPISVTVESPMTPQSFVRRIAVFNEKNPQPNVAIFHLTPRAGRAAVITRIRLADTQKVTAIAELSDGTFWSDNAEVIVTLAACVETN